MNNFPVSVGYEGSGNADDFLLQPHGCHWMELDSLVWGKAARYQNISMAVLEQVGLNVMKRSDE